MSKLGIVGWAGSSACLGTRTAWRHKKRMKRSSQRYVIELALQTEAPAAGCRYSVSCCAFTKLTLTSLYRNPLLPIPDYIAQPPTQTSRTFLHSQCVRHGSYHTKEALRHRSAVPFPGGSRSAPLWPHRQKDNKDRAKRQRKRAFRKDADHSYKYEARGYRGNTSADRCLGLLRNATTSRPGSRHLVNRHLVSASQKKTLTTQALRTIPLARV